MTAAPCTPAMPAGLPAFSEHGQGDRAVLLLHGIGGGQAIWAGTAPALAAAGWRVLVMDFPGYGTSPGPTNLDTMVAAVAALRAHAAATGSTRCWLLGHSMGGMLAQEWFARGQPGGAVQGLVLACTSPAFGRADGRWQADFLAERLAPLDAGLGMAGVAASLVPAMVSPAAVPGAAEAAQAVMARVPEATYRQALQAIVTFDRRAALPQINVPTLCLAGEHDRTAPPLVLQRMAQHIPGAACQVLADAGHIANVEQPAAFAAAVLAFMQAHSPERV